MNPIILRYNMSMIEDAIKNDAKMSGELQEPLRRKAPCEIAAEFVRDAAGQLIGATVTTKYDEASDISPLDAFREEAVNRIQGFERRGMSKRLRASLRNDLLGQIVFSSDFAGVFGEWIRACEHRHEPVNRHELFPLLTNLAGLVSECANVEEVAQVLRQSLAEAIAAETPSQWFVFLFDGRRRMKQRSRASGADDIVIPTDGGTRAGAAR